MNFHNFIRDTADWQTVRSDLKWANPFLEVYETETRTPSRPDGRPWTVVHRKGAAVVAPLTRE
ncbi:MAG: hypothetical protein QOD99_2451, partial [Chthoniobacter sp.]|nr:hypothetical protein [Chthoniobacter sp.]